VKTIKEFRTAVREVPEAVQQLGSGVRHANQTMTILAVVAVIALALSTVALMRVSAVSRAHR
jgi:uncharacterized protein YoxC